MAEVEILPPHNTDIDHRRETPGWSLDQLVSSWLSEMTDSDHTAEAYRRDMRQFLTWCAQHELHVLSIRPPEAKMYRHHLTKDQGYSARTAARKLSTVSSFYRHAVESGAREFNPLRELRRPKYDSKHSPTHGLTSAEARAILQAAPELRQRVMDPRCLLLALGLMVDLGARVSEVCNLDLSDVGSHDGMRSLTLHTKGSEVRVRPITPQWAPLLDEWRMNRPYDPEQPALLLDYRGRRISRNQLAELLRRLAKQVGVAEADQITPHSMRHAFNAIAREANIPLEDRQRALGHARPETTQLYGRAAADLARDPAHVVSAVTFTRNRTTGEETA